MQRIRTFLKNNRAATTIEYSLIASLIAVAGLGAFQSLGAHVSSKYDAVDQTLGNTL